MDETADDHETAETSYSAAAARSARRAPFRTEEERAAVLKGAAAQRWYDATVGGEPTASPLPPHHHHGAAQYVQEEHWRLDDAIQEWMSEQQRSRWKDVPSVLPEDGAPSASLGPPTAQAYAAQLRAPPEPLGGSPRPS